VPWRYITVILLSGRGAYIKRECPTNSLKQIGEKPELQKERLVGGGRQIGLVLGYGVNDNVGCNCLD